MEKQRVHNSLEQAVEMMSWFPDYLFEVTDEPGELPSLTLKRLKRQFGNSDKDSLRRICDEIQMFDSDVQPDIAAYVCGFPEEDLVGMLQGELEVIIGLLDERFPPHLEVEESVQATPASAIVVASSPKVRRTTPKKAPEEFRPTFVSVGNPLTTQLEESSTDPSLSNDRDFGELSWQSDALCAQTNPEAFFPEKGGSTREAKKICSHCESKVECLAYALKNEERFGIWGGLSERERRKLRKTSGDEVSYEVVAKRALGKNSQYV